MTTIATRPFDVVTHLDDQEAISAYLTATLETGDAGDFATALGNVARARGMAQIAAETGLSREALYRTLSAAGNPELSTLLKVMTTLNLQLAVTPPNQCRGIRSREENIMQRIIVVMRHSDNLTCQHPGCVAYRKLLDHGAALHTTWRGQIARRRCELSMLAAAGDCGLKQKDLVEARDHLVEHLGDTVDPVAKPTADNRDAVHAHNAAMGSLHPNGHNLGPYVEVKKTPRAALPAVHRETDHYVLSFLRE